MTPFDLKSHYSRFLKGHEGKLHFAAHSHHFWPDVTREAQLEYWDDCAKKSDGKWEKIFGEVIPKAQSHIASILKLKKKEQIVFAPNTHELTARLLSLFIGRSELRILTTSSEFHSWRRQVSRLNELPAVTLDVVSTKDLLHNRKKFIAALKDQLKEEPDLFFISQVFFDSGLALTDQDLKELLEAKRSKTIMVVDGYHAFAAIPTDLSALEGRIFYLAGGYKYAQAGEGAGFIVVPEGDWRPAYTGWFAEFGELSRPAGTEVGYRKDGMAFIGATQDSSGLYRFNAVWDLFKEEGLSVDRIHQIISKNQEYFLKKLPVHFLKTHALTSLYQPSLEWHGHFLTFEAQTEEKARELEEALKRQEIVIDRRGKNLRFGFGLYQNQEDIDLLIGRLEKLA